MRSGQLPSTRPQGSAFRSAGIRTGRSFFERLGFLYEHQIRLSILGELNMREMGPKQYFEQIGGTSYASVHRHFKKMADHGWIRKVRRAPSTGRGRPEDLYRTTELAVIDDEAWSQIPVSIRDALTILLLEEAANRLGAAAAANTLAHDNSVSGFDRLVVDEVGWSQAIDLLYAQYRALIQEQTDAKIRLEESGSEPSLLVVELAAFELAKTPPPDGTEQRLLPAMSPSRGAPEWEHRIAKVLTDWRNLEIVSALNAEALDPSQLLKRIGGVSVESFDNRCKRLVRLGWLVKINEPRDGACGGATQNVYRATVPVVSEVAVCTPIPLAARKGEVWTAFEQFSREALAAVRGGTFNSRDDRHFTMCRLLVDERGKQQIAEGLRTTREQLARIHRESRARIDRHAGIDVEIGVLITSFESPVIQKPDIADPNCSHASWLQTSRA